MSSGVLSPSPVGGVPIDADFAPSVLFASLYTILIAVAIYRLSHPSTRTMVSIGTLIFIIERVVVFSLRATQVKMPPEPGTIAYYALTSYSQSTLAAGYTSLASNALRVLQSLVVNTTMGDTPKDAEDTEADFNSASLPTASHSGTDSLEKDMNAVVNDVKKDGVEIIESSDAVSTLPRVSLNGSTFPGERDMPKTRARYRMWFGLLTLVCLLAFALGLVATGKKYVQSWSDAGAAISVRRIRCAANAVAFVPILALQGISLWAFFGMPRVHRRDAALLMFGVGVLLSVIAIYRAVVLPNTTPKLSFTGPGSLNRPRDKVFFYLFHAAPEFLVTAVLICVDVKRMFGTGMWGDRPWDPKPKARASS